MRSEDIERVARMLREGRLSIVSGGILSQFEKRFAAFSGCRHAVAFNNGTAAIYAALWAVGVRAGDDVLVCDYGFHGAAAAVLALGARVVPVDCLEDSFTIDPDDIPAKRTVRTKAILAHNPWGVPARLDAVRRGAPDLPIVADAAHAHGALYRGKALGAWADITCYSLGQAKLITGGELGCAVTDQTTYRDRMLTLGHVNRVPGDLVGDDWDGNAVGLKLRPHAVALTLAHAQVRRFAEKRAALIATCTRLERGFADAGFVPQAMPAGAERVYWRIVLRLDDAVFARVETAAVERALCERGVPVEPCHYLPTLQNQPIFRWPDHAGRCLPAPCPIAERVARRTVTLPAPARLPEQVLRATIAAAVATSVALGAHAQHGG
ncbi:MAG: aminotransferase class I/II-fold pyridoxal phosphate-dependent enzyme [Gammaproteobacteria bacterium]|nr:aminotransferase class I/II-fold pyridoxal phosphate-dependent enzyme [Gammaproteobacteria bacterium]